MRLCIVSPHLDDAILSCGVLMQRSRARSDEVLSLGVFTAGTLSEARKREDRLAMAKIGAVPFHLDELDAPDRDPTFRDLRALFFAALDPEDECITRIGRRVQEFLSDYRIDIVYFPLGVGTHIDHRITHEVGRRIRGIAVRFYEDRPYALWPGVLQGRMNQLGADVDLPRVTARMMVDAISSYHYLRYFMPAGEHREATLPLYTAAATGTSTRTLPARSEALQATADELRTLYGSLRLYASQMDSIYPDCDTFVGDVLRSERTLSGWAGYVERTWTLAA